MKKAISLLLCLVLLLGLAPGMLAAEADEPEVPEASETAAAQAEAEPEALPAGKAPAEKPLYEELPVEPEDEDEAVLMAGTATVSATVSFPAGASASGRMYVYLVKACTTDETGLVTAEPRITSKAAEVNGSSAFSVTFTNVEAGEYFFGIYSGEAMLEGLTNGSYYLNADGTRAGGQYTATTFKVAAGAAVSRSFSLLKPERTISGTLKFSQPMPQEQQLEVMSNGGSDNSYSYFNIPKGASQVPFSVSADESSLIYIDFCNTTTGGSWHRFCINGTLEGNWDDVVYFDPVRGSVSGLVIDADALLEGVTASETIPVTVNVKLPETLTERRRYYVYAIDANGASRSTSVYGQKDRSEFSVHMQLSADAPYTFAYREMTGVNRNFNNESFGWRYAADSGVSALASAAKSYTFTGDSGTVTIQEPACLKITGVLDRGSFMAGGSSIGYVKAVFPGEETYTALVNFSGAETEKSYTIYVPAALRGQAYSLSAARAEQISSNRPLAATWTAPAAGTLTGNVTAPRLSIDAAGFTVSGSVSLPEGIVIPAGGICAHVHDSDSSLGVRYVFRAGLTSADFSFTDYSDAASVNYYCSLENSTGITTSASTSATREEAGVSGLSFTFSHTVVISGKVKLPAGVTDLGANIQINDTTASIIKGETEAPYSVRVTMGRRVDISAVLQAETYLCLVEDWFYLNKKWEYTREGGDFPIAETDRTGVDLVLSKARLLSGTLASGNGTPLRLLDTPEGARRSISVGVSGSYSKSWSRTLTEDMSWSCKVPEEMADNVRIYVEIQSDSYVNALRGTYYYSTGADAVTSWSDASTLEVPEAGLSGLTIRLNTGWVLSGTLVPPEGAYLRGSSSTSSATMDVNARSDSDSWAGSAYLRPGEGPWPFAVVVPPEAAVYSFEVSAGLSSSWTTNVIFKGSSDNWDISGDTALIRIPLALAGSIVSGTVFRPAGYTDYIFGSVYVEMLEEGAVSATYSSSFRSMSSDVASSSYRVLIPTTETASVYRVRAQINSDSNALAKRIWISASGVTNKEAEAKTFSLQAEARHDFTPILQPSYLSGKIYIPEGITEAFSISVTGVESQYFTIDPARCPEDAGGTYYAYALRTSRESGSDFKFRYNVSTEGETELYTDSTVYVKTDGTMTTVSGDADYWQYVPGEEHTLDFTLAKAVILSGAITDEAGDPLRWTQGDDAYVYLYLSSTGTYSARMRIAEDGTWTVKLPPDKKGSYSWLRVTAEGNYFEQALPNTYYYSAEGKVVTDAAQASPVEIPAAGLSGLNIRMNTGWLLTGQLKLPEGGYYRLQPDHSSTYTRTMSVWASDADSGETYYGSAQIGVGTDPWTYSITVPKTETTYTVSSGSIFIDDSVIDTNVLFDKTVTVEGVSVTGNTTVPDMTLHIVKAIITGTVSRPEGYTGYVSFRVNVITSPENVYTARPYMSADADSTEYSIAIPDTDESSTYTVRCNLSYTGLVSQSWLAESGMTRKEDEARTFTFGKDSDTHDFTLMVLPPFVYGKLYIPDGVDGRFTVYIQGRGSKSILVDTATDALRDAQGRYVPYSLTNEGEEFNFELSYRITSDETGKLLSPNNYVYFYLKEDGSLTSDRNEAKSFAYTGTGINADVHLMAWHDMDDRYVFQSAHGCSGEIDPATGEYRTYVYTYEIPEGVYSVKFHIAFSDCTVKVNNSNMYSNSTVTVYRSSGSQVRFMIQPNTTQRYYGFGVDMITIDGTPTGVSSPSVFTESGSDYAGIISDVRQGKTLNALFLGNTEEAVTRTALAAAYDADGRFLQARLAEVAVSSAGAVNARFSFKADETISEVKVMLLDEEKCAPVMQQIVIKAD
jgi:hypothetical protein